MHVDGEPKTVLNHTEVWGKAKLFCWNWCFAHYWLADVRTVHKKLKRFTSCWYFGLDTVTLQFVGIMTRVMIVCEGCCKASRSVNCHRYEQNQITDLLWSFGFIFTASEVQNSEGLPEWITRTWLYLGNRCTCRHETFTSTNLSNY